MASRFQTRPERLAEERRAAAAERASQVPERLNPPFPYPSIAFEAAKLGAKRLKVKAVAES